MTSQPDQYELEVFDSNSMDWLDGASLCQEGGVRRL